MRAHFTVLTLIVSVNNDIDVLDVDDSTVEEERVNLKNLMNADEIAAALKDYDKQKALFSKWLKDEETTNCVVNKLMEFDNRIKNMPILAKFNNARTSVAYN
ncbi:hypothetical protein PInf_010290 [Phytophthora infestans]|nr:hypothetical protein PInf_010290 [Phytophthora infestans]